MAGPCSQVLEIEYDPDCTPEQVEQVLLALDRWSVRTAGHVSHHRGAERRDLRTMLIVEGPPPTPDKGSVRQIFHVPSRNISRTGLGLVLPPVFVPRVLSDATPLVRSEVAFRVGQEIKVQFGPTEMTIPALRGVIVRMRAVHLGFWELGVRFVAREGGAGGPTKAATADCSCQGN